MFEYVFCIMKPDALERGLMGEILTRVERTNLRIAAMEMRHKTEAWCDRHYVHVKNEKFYARLAAFMTSQPILGFIVSGPEAHRRMRALAGPTRPWEAAPGTIRGDFGGNPAMYNCIHVSESQDSTIHEFELFADPETDKDN